ncbi:MAG: hypothetical protein MK102_07745 [Fuerstiella sp.]|nr:hypothetical protein [Fuerstiella sp.]
MPITLNLHTPDFDSELGNSADSDNATPLTVVLKVALIPENPHGGEPSRPPSCTDRPTNNRISIGTDWANDLHGRVFRINQWGSSAFQHFRTRFKREVEQAWNKRIFILFPDQTNRNQALNPTDYRSLQNLSLIGRKPPFLRCRLRIDLVPHTTRHHALMHVLNVASGQSCQFQAFVGRRAGGVDEGFLTNQCSARTLAHETGHLLGLDHVNADDPRCRNNRHASICYGETERERRDVMGTGTVVHGGHARRWLEAIRQHTRHQPGWQATHIDPPMDELLRRATQ